MIPRKEAKKKGREKLIKVNRKEERVGWNK